MRHRLDVERLELGRLTGLARERLEIPQLTMGDEIDRLLHDAPVFVMDGGRTRRRSERESMKQYARLALAAALVVCAAAPARADDSSDVQSKVSAALKAAKSFVATTLFPAAGASTISVFVAPDRVKTDVAYGTNASTVILIGTEAYTSRNGAPYEKATVPANILAELTSLTVVNVTAVKPDIVEAGTALGAFTTVVGAPPHTLTLTCTYDKKTYRLAKCASEQIIQTFANYDDPKNIVEPPKGAK
ncbi:MAG: hypothetical protein NVS2B17_12550 [Candidatus Velthaea sp.]